MLYRLNGIHTLSVSDFVKSLSEKHDLSVKNGNLVIKVRNSRRKPKLDDLQVRLIKAFKAEIVSHVQSLEVKKVKVEQVKVEQVEPFDREAYNREHFNIKPRKLTSYPPEVERLAPWLASKSHYTDEREFIASLYNKEGDRGVELRRFFFGQSLKG